MHKLSTRLGASVLIEALLIPAVAQAHGVVGPRFFPATIASDDPFAADELALPTVTFFDHERGYDFDYGKSIVPGFAIAVGLGYVHATPPGEPAASGFTNLAISPTLELVRDAPHEFI